MLTSLSIALEWNTVIYIVIVDNIRCCMNIFFIDKDPVKAAYQQTDKLVVKMTLETAQLLSTARRYFGDTSSCLYKSTHINHPSNIW